MRKVLLPVVLAVVAVSAVPAAAQSAPFCPEGWACGSPDGHRAETRQATGHRDACLIHHALTTSDGAWQMMTILFSTDSTRDVDMGFAVTLLESATPGKDYRQIPLRSIRLLSADRRLDTREWRVTGAGTTRTIVRVPVMEGVEKAVGASIAIATGAAYGVLAETTDGRRVRIESAATARVPTAIRAFQSCIENRSKPAGN